VFLAPDDEDDVLNLLDEWEAFHGRGNGAYSASSRSRRYKARSGAKNGCSSERALAGCEVRSPSYERSYMKNSGIAKPYEESLTR
jgi:hypothetical protein